MIHELCVWESDGGPPGEMPEPWPPRMSDEQLKKFVLGWCDGQVFSDLHCGSDRDVPMSFMVIALGGLAEYEREDLENVGRIWEWAREGRGPYMNGNPTFWSCRFMCRADWQRAVRAIEREEARRKQMEL